jgi:hypothetical protein
LQESPFWIYRHSDLSLNARQVHKSWDGLIKPKDHPFWQTHYPPQGFGCNCYVIGASSERITEVIGGNKNTKLADDWQKTNPATGTPFGIDKGWDYQVGKSTLHHFDKHAKTPDCVGFTALTKTGNCLKALSGQKKWKDYGRPDLRHVDDKFKLDEPEILVHAENRHAAYLLLSTTLGVSKKEPTKVIQSPLEQIVIHDYLLEHMIEKDKDKRERYANFILPTLLDPYEIWNTEYDDTTRRRYIGLFKGKRDFFVSIRVNKDGSIFWNMMQATHKDMNGKRVGFPIFTKD